MEGGRVADHDEGRNQAEHEAQDRPQKLSLNLASSGRAESAVLGDPGGKRCA